MALYTSTNFVFGFIARNDWIRLFLPMLCHQVCTAWACFMDISATGTVLYLADIVEQYSKPFHYHFNCYSITTRKIILTTIDNDLLRLIRINNIVTGGSHQATWFLQMHGSIFYGREIILYISQCKEELPINRIWLDAGKKDCRLL
jgi:hypothetical protein